MPSQKVSQPSAPRYEWGWASTEYHVISWVYDNWGTFCGGVNIKAVHGKSNKTHCIVLKYLLGTIHWFRLDFPKQKWQINKSKNSRIINRYNDMNPITNMFLSRIENGHDPIHWGIEEEPLLNEVYRNLQTIIHEISIKDGSSKKEVEFLFKFIFYCPYSKKIWDRRLMFFDWIEMIVSMVFFFENAIIIKFDRTDMPNYMFWDCFLDSMSDDFNDFRSLLKRGSSIDISESFIIVDFISAYLFKTAAIGNKNARLSCVHGLAHLAQWSSIEFIARVIELDSIESRYIKNVLDSRDPDASLN